MQHVALTFMPVRPWEREKKLSLVKLFGHFDLILKLWAEILKLIISFQVQVKLMGSDLISNAVKW